MKKYYCPNCGHAFSQQEFNTGYDARYSSPEAFYVTCCRNDGWSSLTLQPPKLEQTKWYHTISDVHIWPDGSMSIIQDLS